MTGIRSRWPQTCQVVNVQPPIHPAELVLRRCSLSDHTLRNCSRARQRAASNWAPSHWHAVPWSYPGSKQTRPPARGPRLRGSNKPVAELSQLLVNPSELPLQECDRSPKQVASDREIAETIEAQIQEIARLRGQVAVLTHAKESDTKRFRTIALERHREREELNAELGKLKVGLPGHGGQNGQQESCGAFLEAHKSTELAASRLAAQDVRAGSVTSPPKCSPLLLAGDAAPDR